MNETFDMIALEQALKCITAKALKLYWDGEDKYTTEKFMKANRGGEYIVAMRSDNMTCVELRYRTPELPEGDMGWLVSDFCTDFLNHEQLLNVLRMVTMHLEGM